MLGYLVFELFNNIFRIDSIHYKLSYLNETQVLIFTELIYTGHNFACLILLLNNKRQLMHPVAW
jgi:hypothetical protein